MFWGLIMEPSRRYSQVVKKSFHISMAALDFDTAGAEAAQVICSTEGRHYLMCTLKKPDIPQCALDLEIAAGSEVSFASNGKGHVHLTGYITEEDGNGSALVDLEEVAVQEEQISKKKKKQSKEQLKQQPPSKKVKLQNGTTTGSATTTDEDDDEFEEEEEAIEATDSDHTTDDDSEEVEDEIDDEEDGEEQSSQKKEKTKKNGMGEKPQQKTITLKDGVVVEDLVEGAGPPARSGKIVSVYYEGRLQKSNKMFDKSTKGTGFRFRLGAGEVIKGWDIGVVGMKVGGTRKVICPPQVAYGRKGSPPAIPPNSTLVFTVTLNQIK